MTKAVILIPTSAEANLAAALDAAKTTGTAVFNAVEDVKAAQALIANNQKDVLLEKIVADFQALNANLVVVKGVQPSAQAFCKQLKLCDCTNLRCTNYLSSKQ